MVSEFFFWFCFWVIKSLGEILKMVNQVGFRKKKKKKKEKNTRATRRGAHHARPDTGNLFRSTAINKQSGCCASVRRARVRCALCLCANYRSQHIHLLTLTHTHTLSPPRLTGSLNSVCARSLATSINGRSPSPRLPDESSSERRILRGLRLCRRSR